MRQRIRAECYDVVKAKSRDDAIDGCDWKVGDRATVVEIMAMSNGDGTFTVYPLFGKEEREGNVFHVADL